MDVMLLAGLAVVAGLAVLVWSADRFVDGAAATARHFGVPSLIIGMVVIGFGTSAPEMVVSAIAALGGNPELALGNAYGSNIANIGLILGITALISPIRVHSDVLRRELPILAAVTLLAAIQLEDHTIGRGDAWLLLGVFAAIMTWTVLTGLRSGSDTLAAEAEHEVAEHAMPLPRALFWLALGLVLLIASSRLLVWGAVEIAQALGVSDLIIGLTIVAVGTSLPELASSLAAVKKNEHDMALGNVIGSNLFNTLAVVGIAGAIQPMTVPSEVLTRDVLVMGLLTVALFLMCRGRRGAGGQVNRIEGGLLLAAWLGYTGWLVAGVLG